LGDLLEDAAADALRVPFVLGDEEVHQLVSAVFPDPVVTTHDGTARFQSIEAWVHTDVRGWTLADMVDDDQYRLLVREARRRLSRFTDTHGRVTFPAPALITTVEV
jgi:hypothetical protein